MTTKELNLSVRRLKKKYKTMKSDDYNFMVSEIKRIYYADPEFKYLNRNSILILLKLNLIFRVMPFRQFGIKIEL